MSERVRIFVGGLFASAEEAKAAQCAPADADARRMLPVDYLDQGWAFAEFQVEAAATPFGERFLNVAVFSREVPAGAVSRSPAGDHGSARGRSPYGAVGPGNPGECEAN